MKTIALILSTVILQMYCYSQANFDKQKEVVLSVINSIIQNDSTKFYKLVATDPQKKYQLVYDYKFLNKRFQKLKSPVSIDSIRQFNGQSSFLKWNFEIRVHIIDEKYDYIDLEFMFDGENSNNIFYFSKHIHWIKEELLIDAPKRTN